MIRFLLKVEEADQSPMEPIPIVNQVVSEPLPASEPSQKPTATLVDEVPSQSKFAKLSLFDDSDSSDGELFKIKTPADKLAKMEAPLKSGGLKSNAKINSSLLGSGSDDSSVFSSHQAGIPTPKITTPSFLLADSDDDGSYSFLSTLIYEALNVLNAFDLLDDLFASTPKRRVRSNPDPTIVGGVSISDPPPTDPLLNF